MESGTVSDLLVGSVYRNAHGKRQEELLSLQMRFLNSTTESYDQVAVVQSDLVRHPPSPIFQHIDLLQGRKKRGWVSLIHVDGLQRLRRYFVERQESYDWFLFMDSDAFPIRTDWLQTLKTDMGDRYDIAIIHRYENLENRLHASVLLAKRKALLNLDFQARVFKDITGNKEHDVTIGKYQGHLRDRVLPLIRSNMTQVHPLLCGIYSDLFYHHGSGSSKHQFRAQHFYKDWWGHKPDATDNLFQSLTRDPERFISQLAGWNPEKYAKYKPSNLWLKPHYKLL
jgi:hypothetical protein